MNHNSRIINHLAYADDIVIFNGGNNKTIKLIKYQIRRYGKASGQKVNNNKSFFITAPNTAPQRINRMRRMTGNSSFWRDNWTGLGALAKLCQGPGLYK
ncbi:hypothetical protein P3S68_020184 [Capsicum galapagoense]